MENASKALIMAGSVLLAILVIGALVFMFNALKSLKTTETDSEEVVQLAKFNQKMELYNRDLYGPELISLANLITDYNERLAADYTGYKKITFKVNMHDIKIEMEGYMDETYNGFEKIITDYQKLEETLNTYKNLETVLDVDVKKSAKDWAGMTDDQKSVYLQNLQKSKNLSDSKIQVIREKMEELAEGYSNAKTASNTFKNRKFETTFKYDNYTGRVIEINIKVKPI